VDGPSSTGIDLFRSLFGFLMSDITPMLHVNFVFRQTDCRQISCRSAKIHSSPISTRQHNESRTLAYSVADGYSQIHEDQFNDMLILFKFLT
jgi:hypothetical protein